MSVAQSKFYLTGHLLCGRTEEDAEPRLEVCALARCVPPAEVDAVGQHEGAGPRVEHVLGRGEDEAGDQLEVGVLVGAVERAGGLLGGAEGETVEVEPLRGAELQGRERGRERQGRGGLYQRGHFRALKSLS